MIKENAKNAKRHIAMKFALIVSLIFALLLSCAPEPIIEEVKPEEPPEPGVLFAYRSDNPTQGEFSKVVLTFKSPSGVTERPRVYLYGEPRSIKLGDFPPGKVSWQIEWYDDSGILLAEDSGSGTVSSGENTPIKLDMPRMYADAFIILEGLEDIESAESYEETNIIIGGISASIPYSLSGGYSMRVPVGMNEVSAEMHDAWAWSGKVSVSSLGSPNLIRIPMKECLGSFKLYLSDNTPTASENSYIFTVKNKEVTVDGYEVTKEGDAYLFKGIPYGDYTVSATAWSADGNMAGSSTSSNAPHVNDTYVDDVHMTVWNRFNEVTIEPIYPDYFNDSDCTMRIRAMGPNGVSESDSGWIKLPDGDYEAVVEIYREGKLIAEGRKNFSTESTSKLEVPMKEYGHRLEIDIPEMASFANTGKVESVVLEFDGRTYAQDAHSFAPWIFEDILVDTVSLDFTLSDGKQKYYSHHLVNLLTTERFELEPELFDGLSSIEVSMTSDGKDIYGTKCTLTHESGEKIDVDSSYGRPWRESGLKPGRWTIECIVMHGDRMWGTGTTETVLSPDTSSSIAVEIVPVMNSLRLKLDGISADYSGYVRLYLRSSDFSIEKEVRPGDTEILFENLIGGEYGAELYIPAVSEKPVGKIEKFYIGGGNENTAQIDISNDLRFCFRLNVPHYSDGRIDVELFGSDGALVEKETVSFVSSDSKKFSVPMNAEAGIYDAVVSWYDSSERLAGRKDCRVTVTSNSYVSIDFITPRGTLLMRFDVPESFHSDEIVIDRGWSHATERYWIEDVAESGISWSLSPDSEKDWNVTVLQAGKPFKEFTISPVIKPLEETVIDISLEDPVAKLRLVPDFGPDADGIVAHISKIAFTIDGNPDFHVEFDPKTGSYADIPFVAPGKHVLIVNAWNGETMILDSKKQIEVPGLISEVKVPISITASGAVDFAFLLPSEIAHLEYAGDILLDFAGPLESGFSLTLSKEQLSRGFNIEKLAAGDWSVNVRAIANGFWDDNYNHPFHDEGCPVIDESIAFSVRAAERNNVTLTLHPVTSTVSFTGMEAGTKGRFKAESTSGRIKIDEWVLPGDTIALPKWDYTMSLDLYSGDTLLSEGRTFRKTVNEDFSVTHEPVEITYPIYIEIAEWKYSSAVRNASWTFRGNQITPENGRFKVYGGEGEVVSYLGGSMLKEAVPVNLVFSEETAGSTVVVSLPIEKVESTLTIDLQGVWGPEGATADITLKYTDGRIMAEHKNVPASGYYVYIPAIPADVDVEMVMKTAQGDVLASGKLFGVSEEEVHPTIWLYKSYAEPEVFLSAPGSTADRVDVRIYREREIIERRVITEGEVSIEKMAPGRYEFSFISYDANGRITDASFYQDDLPAEPGKIVFSPRPDSERVYVDFQIPNMGMDKSIVADVTMKSDRGTYETKEVKMSWGGVYKDGIVLPLDDYEWTVAFRKEGTPARYESYMKGSMSLDDPHKKWVLSGELQSLSLSVTAMIDRELQRFIPSDADITIRVEDLNGGFAEKTLPMDSRIDEYRADFKTIAGAFSVEDASSVSCTVMTSRGFMLAYGKTDSFIRNNDGNAASLTLMPGETRVKADARYLGHMRDSNGGKLQTSAKLKEGSYQMDLTLKGFDADMNEIVFIPAIPSQESNLGIAFNAGSKKIVGYDKLYVQQNGTFLLPEERSPIAIKIKDILGNIIEGGFNIELTDPHGHYSKISGVAGAGTWPLPNGDWHVEASMKDGGWHYAGSKNFTAVEEGELIIEMKYVMTDLHVKIYADSSLGVPDSFLLERMGQLGDDVQQQWTLKGGKNVETNIPDAFMRDGKWRWRLTGLDGSGKPILRETITEETHETTELRFSLTNEDIVK